MSKKKKKLRAIDPISTQLEIIVGGGQLRYKQSGRDTILKKRVKPFTSCWHAAISDMVKAMQDLSYSLSKFPIKIDLSTMQNLSRKIKLETRNESKD